MKKEIEEIELLIKGTKEENIQTLIDNGFELKFHCRTIANYYLPPQTEIKDIRQIKEKCIRIRKSITDSYHEGFKIGNSSIINNSNDTIYKELEIESDIDSLKYEEELINKGFRLIFTDDKDDNIYELKSDNIVFQIQDIEKLGLIIAYDNSSYYNIPNQRELLISDVEKFGIKIIDKNNVNRFIPILNENYKPIPLDDIIDKLRKDNIRK